MIDVTKVSSKLLFAEKDALQDIAQDGPLSTGDRAYYQAIVTEINRRLAAERQALTSLDTRALMSIAKAEHV